MPPLAQKLMGASNLIRSAGSLVALLPSALILLGIVPIPTSVHLLINYITSAVTLVLLITAVLLRDAISRIANTATALLILASVLGGTVTAAYYFSFTRHHIVEPPSGYGDPLIVPLRPSRELRSLMEPYSDDYAEALATSIQRERIAELMGQEDSSTVFVMISLLVGTQILMIMAIVVGAWKLAEVENL